MFWEIELKPPQDVISMETYWAEKLLHIITENLITF